ncbi:hypothetical protein C7974DRAFT_354851 [Boeremia exigua]|uniref:uncharacterized protein n=1 Tax=Boeremia exigua TaxID=749465 RepID=UPI001E8E4012|nr:uncharacterized protein C7974DRAFT_354851 [Boeremia exigua]KAH6637404.1 hypothetical protein C7974DRAFT_354851 [Boeremia exigua]
MMRSRRQFECVAVAVFMLCAWFVFDAHFNTIQEEAVEASVEKPWRYEAVEEDQKIFEQQTIHGDTKETSPTSTTPQLTSTPTQTSAVATPSPALPDRVVIIAKLPTDDTRWVHTDLPDWQSAIYSIDISTPHNISPHDPLTNRTLRTLRNKGMEANAYLAYIVQNYHALPATLAFIHPHRDGYPTAWHTDNPSHSNAVALQTLNTAFVQRNGYANLRCAPDPGCPHEVMPFRDPPEAHRTIEAAMPAAWRELFGNGDVPRVLATPCCAQFAVSRAQVRRRPLEAYQRYYTWLMETPLKDETSGRVFEYLWHVLFGQEAV